MGTIDTAELDRADMRRLAAGHDAALNALMDRHAGPLYQFLFRLLGNEDDARDLAQEAFTRVYRHRERFDGGKFTTWLYTIAANLARTEHRRRSRHPDVSLEAEAGGDGATLGQTLPSPAASPSDQAENAERLRAVRDAVSRLPDELKTALVLCEWEDLSVADAAAVLNTTPKAVESRLYRARQRLRESLARWLP